MAQEREHLGVRRQSRLSGPVFIDKLEEGQAKGCENQPPPGVETVWKSLFPVEVSFMQRACLHVKTVKSLMMAVLHTFAPLTPALGRVPSHTEYPSAVAGQLYCWGPLIVWKWRGEGSDWSISQKVPALEELPWLLFSLPEFIGQVIWAVLLLGLSCCLEWNTPKLSGLKQQTQLYYILWLAQLGWFFSRSPQGLSHVCRWWDWRLLGPPPSPGPLRSHSTQVSSCGLSSRMTQGP